MGFVSKKNYVLLIGTALCYLLITSSRVGQQHVSLPEQKSHLLQPESPDLDPSYKYSNITLVVGVPTVSRPLKRYLTKTLHNLFHLGAPYGRSILVLVLLADLDEAKQLSTWRKLNQTFFREIMNGLLDIVKPEKEYYVGRLTVATASCGGSTGPSCSFIRWRNKQNLDYSYLMRMGAQHGQYYIQLEDDVECGTNFFPNIWTAIEKRTQHPWIMAEATKEGFIGKMFPSDQAILLANYLLDNYDKKPCDWLYPDFLRNQSIPCREDVSISGAVVAQTLRACNQSLKQILLYDNENKALCRHLGKVSSLPGKLWT